MLRLVLLLAVAALAVSTGATPATQTFTRATQDRADDRPGKQVHIVYAVPSNGVDHGLDTDGTLVDTAAVWEQWFVDQTGGSVLRLDTYQGNADVTFLRLPYTEQQIANAAPNELTQFKTALASAGLNDPNKLYGVYYDGASSVMPGCGRGGGGNALGVVYLKSPSPALNCSPVPFHHPGEAAQYREFIMVHELLHGLGMVPTCAPHWTFDNHVSETNDVMTGGIIGNDQQLDVGRDDYFRAHIPGCTDLGDSPFMALVPPGIPTAVTATAGDGQASVAFTPATGTVTSYTVKSSPGTATASGQGSPIVVTGLVGGISYTFTVTAFNGTERGATSAASNAIESAIPPGAPTGVSAVAGDRTATVSFSPPDSPGDSPIVSYTVTASPGGKSASGSGSPITVTDLDDDTEYTFTVTATNHGATGRPSASSNAVVPLPPRRTAEHPPATTPRPGIPVVAVPDRRPPPPPPH